MPKLSLSHNHVCQPQVRVTAFMPLKKMWLTPELKMPSQVKPNPMKKPCAGWHAAMLQIGKMTETMTTKKSYFWTLLQNTSLITGVPTDDEQPEEAGGGEDVPVSFTLLFPLPLTILYHALGFPCRQNFCKCICQIL